MDIQKMIITGRRWDFSAAGFSELIREELKNGYPEMWGKLILDGLPADKKLRILDVGTGPGFFAIILAKLGHNVTGIDCAPMMLEMAERNAKELGVSVNLVNMDSHKTEFEDNSFDLIVSRNVTWTLYDPVSAFTEWRRILKPDGCLCYFDGNWYPETYSEEKLKAVREDERCFRENYGEPPDTYVGDKKTEDDFDGIVTLGKLQRPEWDEENLPRLGYRHIEIYCNINDLVLRQHMRLLYAHMPQFMVKAYK